jgi:hypothetical protein
MAETYTPPPSHPLPPDADEFLASISPREREVHMMAIRILGSSYFMDRCHGYLAWKKEHAKK